MFTAQQVEASINPPDFYHSPLTALIKVEYTTNKGGGLCWDFEKHKILRTVANNHSPGYH